METLTIDRASALQTDFMERVARRLEATSEFRDPLTGRYISGRARRTEEYPPDFSAEFERAQRAAGIYDEVLLDRIGRGARALWEIRPTGFMRFGTELVVLAGVVPPFRELILGLTPRPRDVDDLFGLLPEREGDTPTRVLAVLSPSGWREGSKPVVHASCGGDAVFRFEPAPGGGYRTFPAAADWPPAFLALENEEELIARVLRLVSARRADLVLRGLPARSISREAGVPFKTVRSAFVKAAREDEFLRAVEADGDLVLRRA